MTVEELLIELQGWNSDLEVRLARDYNSPVAAVSVEDDEDDNSEYILIS